MVIFVILSNTNANTDDAFSYFPVLSLTYCEWFFDYANGTSGGQFGVRCPVVSWGKTPLGGHLRLLGSPIQMGRISQMSVAAKELLFLF